LYCPRAKQIREDLDELEQQAKTTLPTGNRRTLPQRDMENTIKMPRARLGLMPQISGSQFMQSREALFLSLMVTNCSGERLYKIQKKK